MAIRSIFYTLAIASFLLAPTYVWADVVLSEIQVEGEKAADEFVELYNDSSESVNLSGWSLRRKSASDITVKGSSLKTFGSSDVIPAQGYFLWANSASIFKDLADTTTGSSLSDNNSLALYDKGGALIDSLTWGTGHALPFSPAQFNNPDGKVSFTRDLDTLLWSTTKKTSPTNSKGESIMIDEDVPIPTPADPVAILINEVLPNPKEKGDAGEFIELYNPTTEPVSLSGWEIRDRTTTGKYVFPNGATIVSLGYLVVTDQDFTLSLNNSNEIISLSDKDKRLVHEVRYEKTKEGVALGLVGNTLRGMRVPTPGMPNSENAEPVTKERVPQKAFRSFATEFRARGKDSDGDKLKFTWDFGDGHKSYKESTTHTYEKTGRYTVTLTTDDGIDTTTETFEIKIERYEAPKLRIVAFLPNPKGKDSDFEWIDIENRGKKSVNLNGFSIATGTKKKSVSNHPINKDFSIPGKSVRRITRNHSLFTLGNERGIIELRAPDGEVIHDVKYKFDKALDDDVVLKKEKGKVLAPIVTPVKTEAVGESSLKENSLSAASDEEEASSPFPAEEIIEDFPSQESVEPTPEVSPLTSEETPSNLEENHSETVSLIRLFQFPGTQFLSGLFGLELSENKNILARWEDVLNTALNEWLTDTTVATKRPEESE